MHGARQQGEFGEFKIPNALRFENAPGGLVRAVISTAAAEAEVYLHGALVTRWTPRGRQPVLFVSPKSLFAPGKPIRGGVPDIFQWFGPRGDSKPGPAQGFARTTEWSIERTQFRGDGRVEITLALAPDDATRAFGLAAFHLRFRVTVGSELKVELETRNDAKEPLTYEEPLHTYFAIADIHQVSVSGIEGTTYIDKTDGFKRKGHLRDTRPDVESPYHHREELLRQHRGLESWIDKTKGMSTWHLTTGRR
jgi:glucose-6-phosphate 1-epimerase